MNDTHAEEAETLLGYFEQHGEQMAYGPVVAHREWWMGAAAALLRDMLPEWSAYKEAEVSNA